MSAAFDAAVVAFGASSGLGDGEDALGIGRIGDVAPSAIVRDEELDAAKLLRPFCARVDGVDGSRDRATVLLERAIAACSLELDEVLPGWRTLRVGLAIGTSSGGMRAFEEHFREGSDPTGVADATYLGPVLRAERPTDFEPVAFVLGACASGTLAIGLAREWLRAGKCDVALCGGFDAVSVFVASGFEALRATCTETGPRPFRAGRDGLALGEGAAVLALVAADVASARGAKPIGLVSGFGASCDAVHLTAPDRDGRGLARAATQAIEDAGGARIDLVSAHGTSTVFNDASEAAALARVLGERSRDVPLHALKGGVGHTLGAAGALETVSALRAMTAAVAPASVGTGPIEGAVRVLDRAEPHEATAALKLSAAFGGANAALVLRRHDASSAPPTARADSPTFVSRAVALTADLGALTAASRLASVTGYAEDKIARADLLVRLTMAAVVALREELASRFGKTLEGAGIVVGHGLATIDTNALYLARIGAAGASRGEPRRFPYTTPNAPAGECAVALGLTGPAFAVGGGPHGGIEALAVAADLVRGGTAADVVVVAVDEAGEGSRRIAPETQPGAVALLVSRDKLAARLEGAAHRLPRVVPAGGAIVLPRAVAAHQALLPLAAAAPPPAVVVTTPWGGIANASFFWL